jgi:hypothetical protein
VTALKFNVDDIVHVRDDVTGHRWNTVGIVVSLFPDSPHPYGVEMPGTFSYARFAAVEVRDPLTGEWTPVTYAARTAT